MVLERLACVCWSDSERGVQLDLYDSQVTPDSLGDLMEAMPWDGTTRSLRDLLGATVGFELDGYTEHSAQPGDDTVFVFWREGGRRPDRYLHSPVR